MKEDNTPTVTKRTRTPSRKLRLRLDTARILKRLNTNRKTVRQKKKESKANAQQSDPANHFLTTRMPRLKKNILVEPPKATVKYKRRQVNKTWLPTHLWHTKRAHMTRPTEPLWRMAIPLSPTEKSYRPSHRAAGAKGCITWDASYMSTVACWGTETALDSMLKAFNFASQGLTQVVQKKWKAGTRFASGWVSERDNEKRPIAPVSVIWFSRKRNETQSKSEKKSDPMLLDKPAQSNPIPAEDRTEAVELDPVWPLEGQVHAGSIEQAQGKTPATKRKAMLDHQILIRIHPSAFHQFWQELLKVAKTQKPQVLIEDLRFEIGSIEIQGPGSTEALLGVLHPFPAKSETHDFGASSWTALAGLSNPNTLPHNAMLSFNIVDPRLSHLPKQIKIPKSSDLAHLDELLVLWPPDKKTAPSPLLSHKIRWRTSTSMPSQKAINRRRTLLPPGQSLEVTPKDPPIPVMLLASRGNSSTSKNTQGTWTVLLPWSAVDPVWRALMYYPLSSGGTPRFGGLNQKQQLAFEQKTPWFPGDLPGTEAGKAWERSESEKRFDAWIRKPPKHRIAWDTLDLGLGRRGELGRGWTCDWEHLFIDTEPAVANGTTTSTKSVKLDSAPSQTQRLLTQRQRKAAKAKEDEETERRTRRRNTSSPESEEEPEKPPTAIMKEKYIQLLPSQSQSLLKNPSTLPIPLQSALMTIQITLLDKGTPSATARIYRLPSIPKPKAATPSSANGSGKSQESQPQSWPSDGPPPAQPNPPISTTDSSGLSPSSAVQVRNLRTRWLALDTHMASSNKPTQKIKTNRHNMPRHQAFHPRESLAKINVLPKNAPKEIVEKWGPSSEFGRGDGEIPKQKPPPPKEKKVRTKSKKEVAMRPEPVKDNDLDTTAKPNPLDEALPGGEEMQELLINPFLQQTEWDKHVPCPDPHDLIGFVTSGGYNLAEGRGIALGGIWIQRLLQGWEDEKARPDDGGGSEKDKERQRRLCIVRNVGESVGRLGVWEVCS